MPTLTEPRESRIDERLNSARRRWRVAHGLRTAAWALVAAAGAAGAVALARWWHPWSAAPPDATWAVWTASVAVVLVVAARLLHLAVATPTLEMLARKADSLFGLRERVATALGVRNQGSMSLVQRLLVEDAEQAASRIDPIALVPGPGATPLLRALAVGVFAVVAWAVPVPEPSSPSVTAAQDLPAVDLGRTAEDARRIAELLEEEAAGDPYLEAVGRAFENLADRIDRGEVDAASVERELEGLLGQFAEALGDEGVDDSLSEMLSTFRPPPVPGEENAEQRTRDIPNLPPPEPGVDVLGDQQAPERGASDRGTSPNAPGMGASEALDELRSALEQRQEEREAQRAELGAPSDADPNQSFSYAEGDPEALAALEERRRLLAESSGAQGETAVGGAQESTDAPGDLAGEGTAALDEGAASPDIDPSQVEVESIELQDQVREEGATVDVQAAPETEYVDVDDVDPDVERPWLRGTQTTDPSRAPALAYREAIGRYFLPDSATAQDEP